MRHEYVRGETYAMPGTTARHNRIVRNVVARLTAAEGAGPCRTYFLDLKVRAARDIFYYPDVVVACSPHNGEAMVFDQPCLLVECTSASTRRTDRGEKLDAYRNIDSLRAYLIVEQLRRQVTYYKRDGRSEWTRSDLGNYGELAIPCPLTQLTLEEIYDGVDAVPLKVGEAEPQGGWLVFEAAEAD